MKRRDVLGDRGPDLGRDGAPFDATGLARGGHRHAWTRTSDSGGSSGGRASPSPTASRVSRASRSMSWRSASTPAGQLPAVRRIVDRWQVDEDVRGGPVGGGLGEQGRDVEVRRGVGVAASGEGLGGPDEDEALLDTGERDLGGDPRGIAHRGLARGDLGIGRPGQLHRRAERGVGGGVLVGELEEAGPQALTGLDGPGQQALVLGELRAAGRQPGDHRDEARTEGRSDGGGAPAARDGLGRGEHAR